MPEPILIGNSFPLSLIRRPVSIVPCSLEDFLAVLDGRPILSFWGHANTLHAAEQRLNRSLKPDSERPVITLSNNGLPTFNGHCFHDCYVLSPNYKNAFRPKVGEEVPADYIDSWQVLKLSWN